MRPWERAAYRVFEFLSSLKLAIVLMLWLMAECIAGTFIESQVNADAARYFVYGSWPFTILLALLALNILCAALIRFPWKRYQTGFVVTHLGLLTILAGSLMTARGHLDALLSVEKGETRSTYKDPAHQVMYRGSVTAKGELRRDETIPVDFGPFTWGHRIFGKIPWRKGHAETIHFANGDSLAVEKFLAHCEDQRIYVPAPSGPPAIEYRLYHPARVDQTRWIAADRQTLTATQSMGMGSIVLWGVDSKAELDHVLHAVPKEAGGLLGTLAYSHGGKHHLFDVKKLQAGPAAIPGTDQKIELIEYLPNARLADKKTWVSEGKDPDNPLLRLRLVGGGQSAEFLAFGLHPEYHTILSQRYGREHLFTYFPAAMPPVVHLVVSLDGKLAYRAFGSQGLIACQLAEVGQEYPCWAELRFVPKSILGESRPDLRVVARPIPPGKPTNPAVLVTYRSGSEHATFWLVRGRPVAPPLPGKSTIVGFDVFERDLPFQIRLDDFEEPKNPGTRQAAMYTSRVTLFDPAQHVEKPVEITMNAPLRYTGKDGVAYTLYQSGIDWSTGQPISTYTVGNDPGLMVKYAGAITLCVGIVLMFYMGGYFKKRPAPTPRATPKPRKREPALSAR